VSIEFAYKKSVIASEATCPPKHEVRRWKQSGTFENAADEVGGNLLRQCLLRIWGKFKKAALAGNKHKTILEAGGIEKYPSYQSFICLKPHIPLFFSEKSVCVDITEIYLV